MSATLTTHRVLTEVYFADEEVKGVQVIASALRENPQAYTLLHVQCDFLRSKGKTEWALQLARQAVNCAPSEFATWSKLTEVYTELGMFDSVRTGQKCDTAIADQLCFKALLTLNSCPMFTYNERDLHRMPTPSKTHLPIKQFIADSNILDEEGSKDTDVRNIGLSFWVNADTTAPYRPMLLFFVFLHLAFGELSQKPMPSWHASSRKLDGTSFSRPGQRFS